MEASIFCTNFTFPKSTQEHNLNHPTLCGAKCSYPAWRSLRTSNIPQPDQVTLPRSASDRTPSNPLHELRILRPSTAASDGLPVDSEWPPSAHASPVPVPRKYGTCCISIWRNQPLSSPHCFPPYKQKYWIFPVRWLATLWQVLFRSLCLKPGSIIPRRYSYEIHHRLNMVASSISLIAIDSSDVPPTTITYHTTAVVSSGPFFHIWTLCYDKDIDRSYWIYCPGRILIDPASYFEGSSVGLPRSEGRNGISDRLVQKEQSKLLKADNRGEILGGSSWLASTSCHNKYYCILLFSGGPWYEPLFISHIYIHSRGFN